MARKSTPKTVNTEVVNPEHEKLIEVLKFTPRTYKIQMWGYGGETVMGTVDRKIYNYFKSRRLDLSDFAWDSDYAEENNIPEEMWPFPPGSWYECDDMGHANGVSRSAGTLQIEDEQSQIIFEKSFDDFDYEEGEPEWACGDEAWIGSKPDGTVVFIGRSNEKGTFFEGEIPLTSPFDITKLELQYDEIDGEEIINVVRYDGEEVENWGGSTDGKSSDFGMYVAGSNEDNNGKWEKYTNMDDIEYTMTEWFPKKIKPVREGIYNIRTPGKNSYTHQATWNGTMWTSTWNNDELKIKEWQGIAYDPDEQDLRDELDRIALEVPGFPTAAEISDLEQMSCVQCDWTGSCEETFSNAHDEMVCPKCGEPVEFVNGDNTDEFTFNDDDMNPWKTSAPTEEKTLTYWTVKPVNKKSIEEQEEYTKDGVTLVRKTGWRWGEWTVATNDGNPPEFEFDGNGQLDINNCYTNNIEEVEMVETNDGCWEELEWRTSPDNEIGDEDRAELEAFIDDEGFYELESKGWYHSETYMYIWGPIEITNEDGSITKVVNE